MIIILQTLRQEIHMSSSMHSFEDRFSMRRRDGFESKNDGRTEMAELGEVKIDILEMVKKCETR